MHACKHLCIPPSPSLLSFIHPSALCTSLQDETDRLTDRYPRSSPPPSSFDTRTAALLLSHRSEFDCRHFCPPLPIVQVVPLFSAYLDSFNLSSSSVHPNPSVRQPLRQITHTTSAGRLFHHGPQHSPSLRDPGCTKVQHPGRDQEGLSVGSRCYHAGLSVSLVFCLPICILAKDEKI